MELGTRVRNKTDGQLGWLVEHEGRTQVRVDRKAMLLIVPYREGEWLEDTQPRLQPLAKARVKFAADRALRMALGEYGVKDWLEIRESQQHEWMQPPKEVDPIRLALYRAIDKVLEGK